MSSPTSVDTLLSRHDSLFDDYPTSPKNSSAPPTTKGPGFFDLPAEIRTHIYDLIFSLPSTYSSAFPPSPSSPVRLCPDYLASTHLLPLLTNRQFHSEAHLLAFSRTLFIITNPYLSLTLGSHISSLLPPRTIACLRHVAFVADARHFRLLRTWSVDGHAFGLPSLKLESLGIILARSSYWHYLFDFNVPLVTLLRGLEGVEKVVFVRNNALIKGTLHTWYNRLVKLMLKTDLVERYERSPARVEKSWWAWECDREKQTVTLEVREAKPEGLSKEEYGEVMAPLYETLMLSMESEEYDPDPMSRVSVGL
ncbi:hypothetical protein K461DRAFT_272377 [Myriangium duriaei CBS 260.36]|uniref:F-box domain-containing protein n=1 Tax=Myriangium duriaei CBS 260.36 TaxID=1168546 RepID=A0A9P4IPF7_9PEZI|nr:hypothetical protein K461DRAFT_272377 [Myriangium duriaei CBS 260.36]